MKAPCSNQVCETIQLVEMMHMPLNPGFIQLQYSCSPGVATSSSLYLVNYRIAQNFDGGNIAIFDAFQLDRQNLTCQIV